MRYIFFQSLLCFILLVSVCTTQAIAACRHALVLALDISGSVNAEEYALQLNGVAAALLSPKVQSLILEQPDAPISLAIFEWSSERHQNLILDWTEIKSRNTLANIAIKVRSHYKDRVTLKTAIGSALNYGKALLDQKTDCDQRTIDISSDGANNDGPPPKETYTTQDFSGITVNALVVTLEDAAEKQNIIVVSREKLVNYFRTQVLHGPGSFSMMAVGYKDYERAMIEKLLLELAPAALSKTTVPLQKKYKRPL